jgi:hypothetical protein
MTQDQFALALQNPQLLALLIKHKAQLDKRTRKRLEQFISEMREEAEKHNAIQDALSMIEGYALWKYDQTLTMEAFLKAARHPDLPQAEMDAFFSAIRKLYVESVAAATARSLRKVVDSHNK